MQEISIVAGATSNYTLTLRRESDDSVITTYGPSDTLAAAVWAGDDQPAIFSPIVAWKTNGSDGLIAISFPGSLTSAVAKGKYLCRVTLTSAGTTLEVARFWVQIDQAPGTGTTYKTYCSYEDMLQVAPWLAELQSDQDQAGFPEQRQNAREWLERTIQSHYLPYGGYNFVAGNVLHLDDYWRQTPGYSKYLQDYLDQDKLMVSNRPKVKRMTAHYATFLVCQAQIGPNDKDNAYQRFADYHLTQARNLVKGYVAEVDLNGSGYPSLVINCGISSMR